MRRAFLLTLCILGTSVAALAQGPSSDQTLQALLTEVRELRQDLRISLARVQTAQILLSRLQTEQAVVTRTSEHLVDSRSKLAAAQDRRKHIEVNNKRLEDALSAEENLAQQKNLRDMINHSKSELELATDEEQQLQMLEFEAGQQLRTEQDKLTALETQLDELVRKMGNPSQH
jgi:chromosome segregation ATPase